MKILSVIYLGILADSLQEWDRNTVKHECVIGGKLPVQGSDLKLGVDSGKIKIDYTDQRISKKVKEALSYALKDWEDIIYISQ